MQIKKNEINKDNAWKYKAFAQINDKKEALFKQTALVKAANSFR